jgi:hypothetical protein
LKSANLCWLSLRQCTIKVMWKTVYWFTFFNLRTTMFTVPWRHCHMWLLWKVNILEKFYYSVYLLIIIIVFKISFSKMHSYFFASISCFSVPLRYELCFIIWKENFYTIYGKWNKYIFSNAEKIKKEHKFCRLPLKSYSFFLCLYVFRSFFTFYERS